jgi:hypothetical protein
MVAEDQEGIMTPHDLSVLIRLWEQERITSEQAIGQMLLQLHNITERVVKLERARPDAFYGSSRSSSGSETAEV